MPLGLVVNSDFMGGTVTAISGNTVTLSGNANATTAFVQVTTSATNSPTVEVTNVEAGLAVGSTLLGKTVTNIASTTITLNGNANAAIATPTFVAFTPVVTVNSSSLATPTVVVASVPSILNVGSTLLGRSVTNIVQHHDHVERQCQCRHRRTHRAAVRRRGPDPVHHHGPDLHRGHQHLQGSAPARGADRRERLGDSGRVLAHFFPRSRADVPHDRRVRGRSGAGNHLQELDDREHATAPGHSAFRSARLEKPTLNFIHREGLVFRANFVPNPYAYGGNGAPPVSARTPPAFPVWNTTG